MKYIFLILLGLVLVIFTIRLISGEDDWICKDGKWVKHGRPAAVMPKAACLK